MTYPTLTPPSQDNPPRQLHYPKRANPTSPPSISLVLSPLIGVGTALSTPPYRHNTTKHNTVSTVHKHSHPSPLKTPQKTRKRNPIKKKPRKRETPAKETSQKMLCPDELHKTPSLLQTSLLHIHTSKNLQVHKSTNPRKYLAI